MVNISSVLIKIPLLIAPYSTGNLENWAAGARSTHTILAVGGIHRLEQKHRYSIHTINILTLYIGITK